MKKTLLLAAAVFLTANVSEAQVTQSVGAGSAVTRIDGSAFFENPASLFDNPYAEGGMFFSRTAMTFNNNGCGFAGCSGSFSGFSGNYMYGNGPGYFSMFLDGGRRFEALEFAVGWGAPSVGVIWKAFLNGTEIDAGTAAMNQGQVIGFFSATGFDELRYTSTCHNDPNCRAPAFDNVNAQFTTTPEPGSMALLATGLAAVAARRRRRKAAEQTA